MFFFLVACLLVLAEKGTGMYSNKEMEGYPAGFLGDCPGSEKEAYIYKKTLRHLSFTVQGPKIARNQYNYFHMKELAKDPLLNFSRKTMLFVPGFMDSPNYLPSFAIADPYINLGYNVLLLEASYLTTHEYPRASRLLRPLGRHIAEMLADLTKEGLNPKTLEIVGLSLGAQTASFIGKSYRDITKTNISRITGLDPSGPCFRNLGPDGRIDQSDADFVDIVSTNIDGYGMAAPVGHVNFYVNGGEYQPGDIFWMLCSTECSHARSFTIWLAALRNPDGFIAIKCDSVQQARNKKCFDTKPLVTNVLGLHAEKSREGIFYLATGTAFPYFLGKKGIRKENDFILSYTKSLNNDSVFRF